MILEEYMVEFDRGDVSESSVREKLELEAIDWSFASRARAHPIEAIHPYPAKFIGEIPRALMRALPCPPGAFVFDPFAGSGTTLMEAQRMGLPAVGVDLNPIACLISRVKTSPRPRGLVEIAREVSAKASQIQSAQKWDIPNVDHWFKPEIQGAISALLGEISSVAATSCHDALRLALSSILVRVSNQDSDTRYAAVEKGTTREAVFTGFIAAAQKLDRALGERDWEIGPAKVVEGNTLTVAPEQLGGPVGLVITSPPYPNAYEYWLYHKYRMWWLGFDPLAVKEQEIGARAHFFKRNPHTEDNFVEQMRGTLSLIDRVLMAGGYACFVIGRSKIRGKIVDNASVIRSAAEMLGFDLIASIERTISSNRKSFNLAHANIKTETVLVLKKS